MADQRTSFLVRLSTRGIERLDCDEVRRMVEYLGGTWTDDGFVFHSAARRDEACDILKRQFGNRYFASIDIPLTHESHGR